MISITDIRTARTASVPIIAVHFGYTDVPITTLGPDRIISAFAELPEAIVSLVEAVQALVGHNKKCDCPRAATIFVAFSLRSTVSRSARQT